MDPPCEIESGRMKILRSVVCTMGKNDSQRIFQLFVVYATSRNLSYGYATCILYNHLNGYVHICIHSYRVPCHRLHTGGVGPRLTHETWRLTCFCYLHLSFTIAKLTAPLLCAFYFSGMSNLSSLSLVTRQVPWCRDWSWRLFARLLMVRHPPAVPSECSSSWVAQLVLPEIIPSSVAAWESWWNHRLHIPLKPYC